MGPRAAWRLEQLGFGDVHDYVAGKADWLAAGLPTIRAEANNGRAIDAFDPDPAVCGLRTSIGDLPRDRMVVVVNAHRIVLGRIRPGTEAERSLVAAEVMEPGPTTVRADEDLEALFERMAARDVDEVIVTTPEGALLGVVHRR